MITKMRKFTFLVTSKEYEGFLDDIRQAGVVHTQELQHGATSPQFEEGKAWADRYKHALERLDKAVEDDKANPTELATNTSGNSAAAAPTDGKACVEAIEALQEKESALHKQLDSTERLIAQLEPWGDFSPESLAKLQDKGWKVRFYTCAAKAFQSEWETSHYATLISDQGGKAYFVTFTKEGEDAADLPAEELTLPAQSLSYYQQEKAETEAQLADIQQTLLQTNATQRDALLAAQVENENSISLSKVRLHSESLAEDAVKMLVGWVPEEKADQLMQLLDSKQIFYEAEAPTLEDNVPVQIRNGKFSTLFEPILRMYSLPKYQDLDILPFMSPFFMLFFGLCMGDAGYGLIILGLCIYLYCTLPKSQKAYATLGIYLGAMTIVCGTLTGTFFGIDLTQQSWAFLAPVKEYFVSENNYKIWGYSPMMVISVIIGLVQVLVGMVLASVKAGLLYGWNYAIGKMSWVVVLLALIACFGLPACGVALPQWLTYALYVIIATCCVGIYFYNTPGKNIFLNFGSGLWNTYGMATGLLGDLLSYIRLFALGLTGGVLGSVFNSLAIDLTSSLSWFIRWLPMLLILLIGHGINFALCMISSFVHPMRLTFVEFFKNANFEGGGEEYDPFRIKTVQAGDAS